MKREQGRLGTSWLADVVEGVKTGQCGRLNCRSRLGRSPVTSEIDRIIRSSTVSPQGVLRGSEA